jgi:hypothetical protein
VACAAGEAIGKRVVEAENCESLREAISGREALDVLSGAAQAQCVACFERRAQVGDGR